MHKPVKKIWKTLKFDNAMLKLQKYIKYKIFPIKMGL